MRVFPSVRSFVITVLLTLVVIVALKLHGLLHLGWLEPNGWLYNWYWGLLSGMAGSLIRMMS